MSFTADQNDVSDLQEHVVQGDVSTLQSPNEHHPDHVHHDLHIGQDRDNETVYSYGTTFKESTFLHQHSQDHDLYRRRHTDPAKEPAAAVDPEQGMCPSNAEEHPQTHTFFSLYTRYCIVFHLLFGIVFTGWWVAGLLLHGIHDPLKSNTGWLKPFLLWLGITLRVFFLHVPVNVLAKPIRWAWEIIGISSIKMLPDRVKIPLAALLTVSVFLIGGFVSPESEDNTRDNRAVCTYFQSL